MPHVSGHKSSGFMSKKTNPYKQAAESMKAAGIGSISGKPISSKAIKIQNIYYDSNKKNNNQSQRQPGLGVANRPPPSVSSSDSNGLLSKEEDKKDDSIVSTVKSVGQEVMDVGKEVIDSVKTGDVDTITKTLEESKDAVLDKLPKGTIEVIKKGVMGKPLYEKKFELWGGTGTVTIDPIKKEGGFFINWQFGGNNKNDNRRY